MLHQCVAGAETAGAAPVRRLSGYEYASAVEDLFGTVLNLGELPADEVLKSFVSNVSQEVTADHLARYVFLADKVAEDLLAAFPERSGCRGAEDRACVEAFLFNRARRAFHGVLEEDDRQRLARLYEEVLTKDGPAAALGAAIRFIVLSPRFLYLVDFGEPVGERSALAPGELAGRLSAFLWRSVPDDLLLNAADSGVLGNEAGIEQQAERMLAHPRAAATLKRLASELLGLSATGSDPLSEQVDAEVGALFTSLALSATGSYGDLLSTTAAIDAPELSAFYGASDGRVPAERAGLLRRASFLRTHSSGGRASPIKRGHAVRKAFLCEVVAAPANGVNMNIPVPAPGQTDRDAFGAHSAEPACWACHQWMDPLGHTFAAYDAAGAYAPTSSDVSATLFPSPGVPLPQASYPNTESFMSAIAQSEFSQQCFAIQVARFASGRAESADDACSLAQVWQSFASSGLGLRQLLVKLSSSAYFRYRHSVKAGGACQ